MGKSVTYFRSGDLDNLFASYAKEIGSKARRGFESNLTVAFSKKNRHQTTMVELFYVFFVSPFFCSEVFLIPMVATKTPRQASLLGARCELTGPPSEDSVALQKLL